MAQQYLTEPTRFTENFENVNRVLEWLYNGAPHTVFSIEVGSVGVDDYNKYFADDHDDNPEIPEECGSVCCIAGAAYQMYHGIFGEQYVEAEKDVYVPWHTVQSYADLFFGTDHEELPFQDSDDGHMLDIFDPALARSYLGGQPSAAQAAQALYNFATTGDPKWETL